ncbi:hypothetical protein JSY36_12190 [Bacillus sp. H-16]|uniref:hypothetical protein n=1 Tax=Alteribacter salitolerans TaxID=2912333 RepID=UPI001966A872|nr:hypothetical protein [Alteribacter salitolerans]MBM7096507.1 hypothetical protein [Alteribacter salitolerans]
MNNNPPQNLQRFVDDINTITAMNNETKKTNNPYDVSLSLKLALVAGFLTTFADALATVAAKIAIDEEIQGNIQNLKDEQAQEAKFTEMQNQLDELQKQLAELTGEKNGKASKK